MLLPPRRHRRHRSKGIVVCTCLWLLTLLWVSLHLSETTLYQNYYNEFERDEHTLAAFVLRQSSTGTPNATTVTTTTATPPHPGSTSPDPTINKRENNNGLKSSHNAQPTDISHNNNSKTLALLDLRLTGGFRNQHMRLTGLVLYAVSQNISNLLLDSLRYDNKVVSRRGNAGGGRIRGQVNNTSGSLGRIPFQDLFDVHNWNRVSDRVGTHILPRLIQYSPDLHPDWDPDLALFRSTIMALTVNASDSVQQSQFRKADMYPHVQHCTQPYAFGSGRRVGQRTWGVYMQHKKDQQSPYGNQLSPTELALIEALQPCPTLANAVKSITHTSHHHGTGDLTRGQTKKDLPPSLPPLMLAIHPRTELDMLKHKCSKIMTRNLTQIFEMVQDSVFFSEPSENGNATNSSKSSKYQQVFLCISRTGMEDKGQRFQQLMDQNLRTLNQASRNGLWKGTVKVREGGEGLATSLGIPWDRVHTAAQIIDFFVAVQATAFLGTFGSSYSTDVWTTRYVLAQKKTNRGEIAGTSSVDPLNYFHDPSGIGLIGNGGLPPAHRVC
jgi:hypothetical protein